MSIQKTFVLPKTDWPRGQQFSICIGEEAMKVAMSFFKLTATCPIFAIKPGTAWPELLDAFGLIGERGVFPSKAAAEEAGWTGEIVRGWHEKLLGSKEYKICILRMGD